MGKKTSAIELYNVVPDLVFLFMYEAMKTVPYDGAVTLVCGNPKETKQEFMKWIFKNKPDINPDNIIREDNDDSVTFWPEENYLFVSGEDKSHDEDYCFVVRGVCGSIEYTL